MAVCLFSSLSSFFCIVFTPLQLISVDSSYSINTLWPESQLLAMYGGNGTTTSKQRVKSRDNENSSPSLPPQFSAATVSVTLKDAVWITYDNFMRKYPHLAAVATTNNGNAVDNNTCATITSATPIPAAAETRNKQCITEMLFSFASDEAAAEAGAEACAGTTDAENTTSLASPVASPSSTVELHGVLSQGSYYSCTLPPYAYTSYMHISIGSNDNYATKYVGQQVRHSVFFSFQLFFGINVLCVHV